MMIILPILTTPLYTFLFEMFGERTLELSRVNPFIPKLKNTFSQPSEKKCVSDVV